MLGQHRATPEHPNYGSATMARDVGAPMEAPCGCPVWGFPGEQCRDRTCGTGASVKGWCGHKAGVPQAPVPASACLISHGSPVLATAGQAGRSCCCQHDASAVVRKTLPSPTFPGWGKPMAQASICPLQHCCGAFKD